MKKLRPLILIVVGIILALLVWYGTTPPPPQPQSLSIESEHRLMSNLEAQIEKLRAESTAGRIPMFTSGFVPTAMPGSGYVKLPPTTNAPLEPAPVIAPKFSNLTNWPNDSRPEVKVFYQFAKAANLYKFEPTVTYDKAEEFPLFRKAIGTSTHEAQMDTRTQRIVSFYSYRDRSASVTDFPGVTEEWKSGTGKWNEEQMIDKTFQILRELGYAETLAATSRGYRHFNPEPWRITLLDGQFQIIYPFAKVILYDEAGNRRVIAEYRMGSDGPVGLVDWYSLY